MQEHRGAIVESIVRKSGYSIKILAEKLEISRNTLYNKFEEHDLSYDFISKLGKIIYYNFVVDFPEMKLVEAPPEDKRAELWRLEKKYAQALERYHSLYRLIQKLANHEDNDAVKEILQQCTERLW